VVDAILADLHVRYPGERTLDTRRQNMEDGIPVEPSAWRFLESAAAS
jgi:LDH2 family malate/lactate/ureidoglycolate dehydrogenase